MDGRSVAEVDAATVAAFRRGDEEAFDRISRQHFRELHVHCYRMVGSFDDAEDLVQDTLLRAWRHRDSYEGRATIRAWLYRIATNACIDAIRRRSRETPMDAPGEGLTIADAGADADVGADADDALPRYARFPWMQPYPDTLLDVAGGEADPPDARLVARESIELAFLATIQRLPPKQRAVLILRDVLDFSAVETAEVLDDSAAAVNSALQRARATMRARRGPASTAPTPAPVQAPTPAPITTLMAARTRPTTRTATSNTSFADAVMLQAYMDAAGRGDVEAMVALLRDDVRMTLLPAGRTWEGRHAVTCEMLERQKDFGDAKVIAIAANRQPAMAVYRRRAGDSDYRAWAIVVLGVTEGKLREIATFASPELFRRFDLPPALPS